MDQARSTDDWHFSDDGVRFLRAGERPRMAARKDLYSEYGCRRLMNDAAFGERRVLGRSLSALVEG
jgi:hypothetical protein